MRGVFACILLVSASFVLFSCRSVQAQPELDPLDLLDGSSSFYLRIPAAADYSLISKLLQKNIDGLSEKNAEKVSERIDTVYVGLARHRKSTEYQLSASCDFPKAAISAAFSKKNGWNAEPIFLPDADGKKVGYTIYDNSAVQVSFPSSDIVCAGRAVPLMVEQFHDRVNSLPLETDSPLLPDVHSWLEYEDGLKNEEIRFFAAKPQSFLTMLTGAQLNFQLVYVRGIMENDPLNDRQFRMQLEFEFRDKRLVPAARGALTVAFGLTDSEVLRETETHLTIRNIKINKNQLYGILVL